MNIHFDTENSDDDSIGSTVTLDSNQVNNGFFKRKYLSLLFLPVLFYFFIYFRDVHNTPYLVFFISYLIFWNFPIIVTINNSKPLYYEDLFVNTSAIPKLDIESKTIETFQKIYHYIIIFTNSILSSILIEYWLFKTKKTSSIYEIIGITGGILQIFKVVNNYSGLLVLKIIKIYIKNNIKIHNFESKSYPTINENSND